MSTRNIILFGANQQARRVLNTSPATDRVLFIADNDRRLQGTLFGNTPVLDPDAIRSATFDLVHITSNAIAPIQTQLQQMGVPKEKTLAQAWAPSPDSAYLDSLKDRHRGERAFILGNGPSLEISDLDLLHRNRELTFSFNKIFLAFEKTEYRPSYFIIEDPLVAENNFLKINSLSGFPKLIPQRLGPWFPRGPETFHFNLVWDIRFPQPPPFTPDPHAMHWGSTVTYTALQWAVYMGCDPVYLIGVDFSFVEPQTTEMDGKVMVSQGEKNHFHPDYRPVGERWFAPNTENQRIAFQAARDATTPNGPRIINATRGGKLEVFPRADFDSLFA